ncbi:MAG: hypothetical protein ABIG92_05205 [Candidatus Omnitrophota bacterium]
MTKQKKSQKKEYKAPTVSDLFGANIRPALGGTQPCTLGGDVNCNLGVTAYGYCNDGQDANGDFCQVGTGATGGVCYGGNFVSGYCQVGTSATDKCVSGQDPTTLCGAGIGVYAGDCYTGTVASQGLCGPGDLAATCAGGTSVSGCLVGSPI